MRERVLGEQSRLVTKKHSHQQRNSEQASEPNVMDCSSIPKYFVSRRKSADQEIGLEDLKQNRWLLGQGRQAVALGGDTNYLVRASDTAREFDLRKSMLVERKVSGSLVNSDG